MKKKHADIEDMLVTFSDHITGNYPEPEQFHENLAKLLEAKKERMSESEYIDSLERNIVFLSDLVVAGEAFLEELLGRINDEVPIDVKVGRVLEEIENDVRKSTRERYREIFLEDGSDEFGELLTAKSEGGGQYSEKLEFNYFFLTTQRMMLLEFFNVISAIRKEYIIGRVDSAAPDHVISHIRMTANFYLGNIGVGEIVKGGKKVTS